jgi:ATP synthase protein I
MFTGTRGQGLIFLRRAALTQVAVAVVGGLSGAALAGVAVGIAVSYGALAAAALSAVLLGRERQSAGHPEWDQHRLLKLFIRASLERLVVLVGLLGVGLGVLKLGALPLLSGFALAQFGWLAAAARGGRG